MGAPFFVCLTDAQGNVESALGSVTMSGPLPAGTNVIGHVIVDSSGLPSGAATAANQTPTPTSGDAFQLTVPTGTVAINLGLAGSAGVSGPCSEIKIACDLDSPGYLLVGYAPGNLQSTGYKIYQGQSETFRISNSNKMWVGASANSSKGSASAT